MKTLPLELNLRNVVRSKRAVTGATRQSGRQKVTFNRQIRIGSDREVVAAVHVYRDGGHEMKKQFSSRAQVLHVMFSSARYALEGCEKLNQKETAP